jgi:uncharacterized membrane protein (DUF441 family)
MRRQGGTTAKVICIVAGIVVVIVSGIAQANASNLAADDLGEAPAIREAQRVQHSQRIEVISKGGLVVGIGLIVIGVFIPRSRVTP